MAELRWAVMGTGRIATGVLPKLIASDGNCVVAIASRDRDRARTLCAGVADANGQTAGALDYEQLLADQSIDAVYVTLPHSLHAEWSRRLLESGKHVLCEKPLCATRAEAQRLADASKRTGRLCTEGFMYMHHPQSARLVELARPGSPIGPIRLIRSNRNVHQTDPYILNSRLSHTLQGGALMDIGCYPLSLALLAMNETPDWSTLHASAELGRWIGDERGGCIERASGERVAIGAPSPQAASPRPQAVPGFVDETCSFSFAFPGGARFEGECSFTMGAPNGASVFFEMIGERGRAYTTHPFSPDSERQSLLVEIEGVAREELFEGAGDKFVNQFTHFARAVRGEVSPLPPIEWSIVEAEAIERIHAAVGLTR
jgi:predicted dehydrogenase